MIVKRIKKVKRITRISNKMSRAERKKAVIYGVYPAKYFISRSRKKYKTRAQNEPPVLV